ncbi:Na(+)-translocating NADH-quinone reductase subunit C [Methylothermus subterraneus]
MRQALRIFAVVLAVSLGCSLVVTSAAVLLKERQARNLRLDKIEHLLAAAGIAAEPDADPLQIFKTRIQALLVDLDRGRPADPKDLGIADPAAFDLRAASRDPTLGEAIPKALDLAGIKRRPRYMPVYLVRDGQAFSRLILPIYGRGLWSTLYGYLALERDLITVAGITFYEHKETPGLGGEVDNPRWKALWRGKQAFDAQGQVAIEVIKGQVDPARPEAVHQVDGLSGATLTTRGVDRLVRYWLGSQGYGPFLAWLRNHLNSLPALDE